MRKRKKRKNEQADCGIAFVSGTAQHVQILERGRPPVFVNKRGSQPSAPVREEGLAGKKKKKKTNRVVARGAAHGTPHSHLHKRRLWTCEKKGTVRGKERIK